MDFNKPTDKLEYPTSSFRFMVAAFHTKYLIVYDIIARYTKFLPVYYLITRIVGLCVTW